MKHINDKQTQNRFVRRCRELFADRRGAGLVEYIILVGAVALASAAAYGQFSTKVGGKITKLGDKVEQLGGN